MRDPSHNCPDDTRMILEIGDTERRATCPRNQLLGRRTEFAIENVNMQKPE